MSEQIIPTFQRLQQAMTQFVRDPELGYQGEKLGGRPVSSARLEAYETLFFNNLTGFFETLFPIASTILGEARVNEIVRAFLKQHRAQTPLFHELGEEFLAFFQQEGEALIQQPQWLFALMHYEWVELGLMVAEGNIPLEGEEGDWRVTPQTPVRLSELAWPLAYPWPVHQISAETADEGIEAQETFLLAYRDAKHQVQFMQMGQVMAGWLWQLQQSGEAISFEQLWQSTSATVECPERREALKAQAWQDWQDLSVEGVLNQDLASCAAVKSRI